MNTSSVKVHCEKCNKPIELVISSEDLSSTQDGILRVMMVHGSPPHAIVVYVDKNMRVREIEYSDSFQMGETSSSTVIQAESLPTNLQKSSNEPCYQAMFSFEDIKEREKSSFVLDKSILRTICETGTICLSAIRHNIAHLEKALGSKIDLDQIEKICEKYVQDGLIRKV